MEYEQLNKLDPERATERISNENLIYTNKGKFFIIIPLGKLEMEEETVYVISPASPLGKSLIGLKINEKVKVNDSEYEVLTIL